MSVVRKHSFALLCVLLVACGGDAEMGDMSEMDDVPPAAQTPASPLAQFAGTWQVVAYDEAGDSLTTYELTATAEPTGWTITFPGRDPIALQVQPGADGVTTVAGPYESVLRAGVMVTTTSTSRIEGDRLVGTFTARYQDAGTDSVLTGRAEGHKIR